MRLGNNVTKHTAPVVAHSCTKIIQTLSPIYAADTTQYCSLESRRRCVLGITNHEQNHFFSSLPIPST